ncbi:hypothetical protein HH310_12435 [Actinoplanes sp. TBRC 11911]|uniref:3'-5' exonuclease n=1 Tax=Actinoplanes sp. TBRC 11911 TaxID=2729386 RepID=UPI00145C73FB|nr:hypothetical protein [Actinoplanes sp. TBRC 11911]NMO52001.1 hypothetical protein [Actinoplanes sp. TBRC 11911]
MSSDPEIVFIDTETTSLRPDRRIWEIGLIAATGVEVWTIRLDDLDMGNADPDALKIGGFYDRHPAFATDMPEAVDEYSALLAVEAATRGKQLAGSNPAFDAEGLAARMRAHGILPSWHYKPLDVPDLAYGWLLGSGRPLPVARKSDLIAMACGVNPARHARHTAIGDCFLFQDLYRVVTSYWPTDENFIAERAVHLLWPGATITACCNRNPADLPRDELITTDMQRTACPSQPRDEKEASADGQP